MLVVRILALSVLYLFYWPPFCFRVIGSTTVLPDIIPPLPACIVYDCREGHGVILGNTQSVSIPVLFLFFFSPVIPISYQNISKCFYLLVCSSDSMTADSTAVHAIGIRSRLDKKRLNVS